MKKAILTAALTALLLLSGCTPDADGGTPESSSTGSATAAESSSIAETEADNPSEPPEITAATGDSAIPTLYRAEHWDGTIQCGTDLVTGAIQQYGADTPAGAASQSVTVTFPEGAHPGRVRILLEARDISSVQAEGDTSTGRVQIALALTEDGQNKFDSAAARLASTGRNISIWLDNQLLSVIYTRSGSVAPVITGESGVGEFTADRAGALADKLNAGALPLSLAAEDFSFTSALMGTDTLDTLTAGIRWGFPLLTLLMLVLYQLAGAVVSVALAGQLALILAAYTGFLPFAQPTTLTASGLFGILLVMGFGVNTGVSIAERIKRELRSGKNLDYSIGAGYKQACSTLFEGRGPIFLAALLLLGSLAIAESAPSQFLSELLGGFHAAAADSVYSFLFAILSGVVSNYIMGVWVSRLMLRSLSKYSALRDPVLYGGNKE